MFTNDLNTFANNMIATMEAFDGIGLAANQVGILKRMIAIDTRKYFLIEELKDWHGTITYQVQGQTIDQPFPTILINPEIVEKEDPVNFPFDGCLSFPGVERGETHRFKNIVLKAQTIHQEPIVITCSGISSICLQHELDHLEGVLFIDRLNEKLEDVEVAAEIEDFSNSPEERRRLKKLKLTDARKTKWNFL